MGGRSKADLIKEILQPGAEFSPIPFWFFNDAFDEDKVRNQLADYVEKGVNGFVLHPRIGIPEEMPYLSEPYFEAVRFIVETAAGLGMKVVLYDEGMYPSGSAHGKVVEANPEYAAKGLFLVEEAEIGPTEEGGIFYNHLGKAKIVRRLSDGKALAYGFTGGTIRGIHFGEDDGEAGAPKAADILNPDAVDEFIRLTHDAYYAHLKEYFGTTIIAFFTDEPCALGRGGAWCREWTSGLDREIEAAGGRIEELEALFAKTESDAVQNATVTIYRKLVKKKLREIFYGRLSEWCERHGIALMGHPAESDDIGEELYFQIPGQDLIMRRVAPETGGLLEPDSVQAKLTADLARLLGRRRNANECFGVCYRDKIPWYMTAGDMKWYIDWLGLRGVNLFVPHAFYYSVAGARKGERPPDVGPNNIWWKHYRQFSDYMKRLSFLMTDAADGARIAVLCDDNRVPYQETATLYENQIEFRYLPAVMLEDATVEDGRVMVNGQYFEKVLNFLGHDYERRFVGKLGNLLLTTTAASSTQENVRRLAASLQVPCAENMENLPGESLPIEENVLSVPDKTLRKVHLHKEGVEMYLFGNEGADTICRTVHLHGWQAPLFFDLWNGAFYQVEGAAEEFTLYLNPRETLLVINVGTEDIEVLSEQEGIPVKYRPSDWFCREVPDWTEEFRLVQEGKNQKVYRLMKFITASDRKEGISDNAAAVGDSAVKGIDRFEVSGAEMVECYCNGAFAGASFWGKHLFEIGPFLTEGANEIRLVVTGNAANIYGGGTIAFGLGVEE